MNKSHRVTQFQLHGWSENSPSSNHTPAGLMPMIAEIQKIQCMNNTTDDPIVVHCRYACICLFVDTVAKIKLSIVKF